MRININEKDKKEIATIYKVQYSECQKQWRDRELMIQAKIKNRLFFSKDGIGGKGNIEPVLINLKGSYFVFLFWLFFILFQNYVILPRRSYENIHFIPVKSYMPRPFCYSTYCSSCSCFLFMLKRCTYLTVHTSPRYANFEFVCDMSMLLILP